MSAYDRVTLGETRKLGAHHFTAEDIKRFANAYDPQSFHIDEEAAKDSIFGGLCASGWHTASAMMRALVEHFGSEAAAAAKHGQAPLHRGPSPGFDALKWTRPVYPGDTITYSGTVTAKRKSKSRPGWGIVTMDAAGANQNGEQVFAVTTHVFVRVTDD